MANEGPSLTKATYDKKRTQRPAPSPGRLEVARQEKITAAAELKRFHKLMHTDKDQCLREIGLLSEEPRPPEPPMKRRKLF